MNTELLNKPSSSEEIAPFSKDLAFELTLETSQDKITISSGNIEKVALDMHAYGFDGKVHFSGFDDDPLDALLASTQVIKLTLTCTFADSYLEGSNPLFDISAQVTSISFKKTSKQIYDRTARFYEIDFTDAAKAVWNHHFPVNIYVNKNMQDVIKDQMGSLLNIDYDWDVLQKTHPILAFSLSHEESRTEGEATSFYSFLNWYLHKDNGILNYDYQTNSYSITKDKVNTNASPATVFEWLVHPPTCHFPEPPRYKTRTLTHTPKSLGELFKEIVFEVYEMIVRDVFGWDNYRLFPEQGPREPASATSPMKDQIEVVFKNFDKSFSFDQLTPGSLLTFKADPKMGGTWSEDTQFKSKVFRSQSVSFAATRKTLNDSVDRPYQAYDLNVSASLEDKEETFVHRPAFNAPKYPFYIQGTVHSRFGAPDQSTYEIEDTENNQGGHYLVEVPIAGKKEKVVVPFTPTVLSGQHYCPLCKDEKVLLAMHFQTALFERILDWQPHTRLKDGIQGNQIVLAHDGQFNYTILRHEYKGGSRPVFTLEQSTGIGKVRTIQIDQDTMTQEIKRPGAKTITITHHDTQGSRWKVIDHMSGVTQETTFNGRTMTHLCKGASGTSKIVQSPQSIDIDCQHFTVNATNINLIAKSSILQKGGAKVDIDTKVASVAAPIVKLGT